MLERREEFGSPLNTLPEIRPGEVARLTDFGTLSWRSSNLRTSRIISAFQQAMLGIRVASWWAKRVDISPAYTRSSKVAPKKDVGFR